MISYMFFFLQGDHGAINLRLLCMIVWEQVSLNVELQPLKYKRAASLCWDVRNSSGANIILKANYWYHFADRARNLLIRVPSILFIDVDSDTQIVSQFDMGGRWGMPDGPLVYYLYARLVGCLDIILLCLILIKVGWVGADLFWDF